MAKLVLILVFSIFTLDSLSGYGLIPRHLTWTPEVISLVAFLAVIFYAARQKSITLNFTYMAVLTLLFLHIALGAALNSLSSGVIFAGLRTYFKYLPFFFLPLVFRFAKNDLTSQLRFVLFLGLAQLPIAAYQRFIESAGSQSGDLVGGSVGTSGHLSIFLLCAAAVWMAFQFRKQIGKRWVFLIVLAILLIPTMLNETKGTVVLAPLALILPALFDSHAQNRVGRILVGLLLVVGFMSVFIPVYDHFRGDRDIVSFYTDENKVEDYLIRSDSADANKAGRLGGILIVGKELAIEPSKFIFGLGIGNTSRSFFGEQFSGEYSNRYSGLGGATVAHLAWEIGWGGMVLLAALAWLIFRDAMLVRTATGTMGALGLAWSAVVILILVSAVYKDMVHNNVLGFLFCYFSGIIVSAAARMRACPAISDGARDTGSFGLQGCIPTERVQRSAL